MPTKRTKAQLEERIAQLEQQLAEAVPVVVVPQAVFDELHQPQNLVEVLERLEDYDPNPERINNGAMINRRSA